MMKKSVGALIALAVCLIAFEPAPAMADKSAATPSAKTAVKKSAKSGAEHPTAERTAAVPYRWQDAVSDCVDEMQRYALTQFKKQWIRAEKLTAAALKQKQTTDKWAECLHSRIERKPYGGLPIPGAALDKFSTRLLEYLRGEFVKNTCTAGALGKVWKGCGAYVRCAYSSLDRVASNLMPRYIARGEPSPWPLRPNSVSELNSKARETALCLQHTVEDERKQSKLPPEVMIWLPEDWQRPQDG